MSEIISRRLKRLMSEKRYSKAEISEKLGIGYSTLWRRLNGERSINIDFLSELAKVLDTSVSYLIGETDNPDAIATSAASVSIQTNDPSRKLVSEPSKLSFHSGDVSIDIPDTPANKKWFNDFLTNMMLMKTPEERMTATA